MSILYTHERNFGCRLNEFIYKGLKILILENERIRVSIIVDRGTDIFEFLYKPKDIDFMWRSFRGIRSLNFLPGNYLNEGNFSEFYYGGWQELFPNAGDSGTYKGVRLPLHGELYSASWEYQIEQNEPKEVVVKFYIRTYRSPYLVEKILKIKSKIPVLYINECITNESRETQDFMWGHHPAFGPPFLSENCIIDLPKCELINDKVNISPTTGRLAIGYKSKWPITKGRKNEDIDLSMIPSIKANSHDLAYIYGFKEGWYGITNRELKVGFGLRWDKDIFKYIWFWQVYGGAIAYPFYSTTYNIGLEPNSSYPPGIENAIKNKTSLKLEPKEKLKLEMIAVAFESGTGIKKIDENGNVYIR
ncbi:MAG: aldose 1-epimerase [Actinobacteria bacterium]|nr:aldose 1-epimerase [Actinomycetota bacterium]